MGLNKLKQTKIDDRRREANYSKRAFTAEPNDTDTETPNLFGKCCGGTLSEKQYADLVYKA
jgi:hypothetical protein